MKKLLILLLVLISLCFQSCGDARKIEITDISVTPVDKEECFAGDELRLNFKYWAEDRNISRIGIQLDIEKKEETETYSWKHLRYNPFAESDYFQTYIENNRGYIVENSINYSKNLSLMTYYSFLDSKALSGDETLSLKVNEEGEYRIHIGIKDESPFAGPSAWICDRIITFKVNPPTEASPTAVE